MKPFTKNLTIGSVGRDVLQLQRLLENMGFGDFVPTGFYGSATRNAVAKFQKTYNILPSVGHFGSKTRAKLNSFFFSRRDIFSAIAISMLGVDASPMDRAIDEYGCADSVNMIHLDAFGFEIGGSTRTAEMILFLRSNTERFQKVTTPEKGDIIISPTESIRTGHVGIMMDSNKVMSNSSSTGLWTQNFTLESWRKRYVETLKLTMEFYRLK